jgi:mandelate racemase
MDIAPLVLIDLETEEGVTGRAYVFCYLPAATRRSSRSCVTQLRVKGDRVTPPTSTRS